MEKRKKIVHVLKSSVYSGAENVVLTVIKGLQEQYDFLYVATDGPIREVLEKEKIPHILMRKFCIQELRKVLKDYKPDIVHAHDFSATVMCALCGHYRIISHLHYDPPWARTWNLRTLTYLYLSRKISRILAVSEGSYSNLVFSNYLKEKTEILINPIDKKRVLSMGETYLPEKYDVIFVGRLVEQKNPIAFIEIIYEVKKHIKDIRCVMIGTGELEQECQQFIEQKNLQNNIILKGFQKNPYCYMAASKVLCVTSKWEGYGLVAAEASILAIPVLSTKTGGITAIIEPEASELCDDKIDFAEKLGLLLTDSVQYASYKQRAAVRAEKLITPEIYAKKLSSIYEKEIKTDENAEKYKN